MIKFIDEIQKNLLSVIFPSGCAGCSTLLLKNEKIICTKCIHNLALTHHFNLKNHEIDRVFYGLLPYEFAASLLYFTKKGITQQLMHQLKYKNRPEIGTFLADFFTNNLKQIEAIKTVDYIISVPIHTSRLQQRGYNQVSSFAETLGKNLEIPVLEGVLIKDKNQKSQITNSKADRLKQIQNVFTIQKSEKIEGKHILLVDDIFTTGATMEACAKEILRVPNTKVSLLTMAYTQS